MTSKVVKNSTPEKRVKRGGRIAGTPNKATKDLRQFVTDFLSQNADTLQTNFNKLSPAQKIYAFEKLLAYALPKPQIIDVNANLENLSENQIEALYLKILKP